MGLPTALPTALQDCHRFSCLLVSNREAAAGQYETQGQQCPMLPGRRTVALSLLSAACSCSLVVHSAALAPCWAAGSTGQTCSKMCLAEAFCMNNSRAGSSGSRFHVSRPADAALTADGTVQQGLRCTPPPARRHAPSGSSVCVHLSGCADEKQAHKVHSNNAQQMLVGKLLLKPRSLHT